MKIATIVEGNTELALREALLGFLRDRLAGRMPKLTFVRQDGRVPTGEKLRRLVSGLLSGQQPADAVIALTDVYTGTREFRDAADAKEKMRTWVGPEPHFHPHAAQHDFEAWLLPYWSKIQCLAGHNKAAPPGHPEAVNHDNPPSQRIKEIFRIGKCNRHYSKVRDGAAILRGVDVLVAARACTELCAFLDTILRLSGGATISGTQRSRATEEAS